MELYLHSLMHFQGVVLNSLKPTDNFTFLIVVSSYLSMDPLFAIRKEDSILITWWQKR
jgi:hypothetical protein